MDRFERWAVALINIAIVAWHFLASFWVLGGMHREVLTGEGYPHAPAVVAVSTSTGLLALILLVATVRITRGPVWPSVAVLSTAALAVIHVIDSLQVWVTHDVGPGFFSGAVWLPLWLAVITLFVRRLRPNNSSKPTPLRGAA
jgi:hypothetical protein